MSVPSTVREALCKHVTLQVESIDRLYLNAYQPQLQTERAVFRFLRENRGQGAVSSRCFAQMTNTFVKSIEAFAARHGLTIRGFERDERKDDVAAACRNDFTGEGVYLIGKAQEKARTFRTEGRRNEATGQTYPWLVRSTAMVNQYYFYGVDDDFGPFFLKFSSYFPYGAKLCINGHEYAKRQLAKRGVAFEPLDNGFASCADPKLLQRICDGLNEAKIDKLLRKWLGRLPHPFTAADRKAGYRYDVSVLQAEFAVTQMLDRPVAGRVFFEQVIRENLDLGRPDQVQLIFQRRVTKRTPGKFRTRVLTEGVLPSLHVDYKSSRIKQYFKEGRALRTETTINNARDFGIGRRLENLPALREVGFQANRRLLDVQKISQDPMPGHIAFEEITQPKRVGTQRASALPFGQPVAMALLHLLLLMRLLPDGFRSRDIGESMAHLLGQRPQDWTQGRRTYQLRRLRLHGLIERLEGTQRYNVTARGLCFALFFARLRARWLNPELTAAMATAK